MRKGDAPPRVKRVAPARAPLTLDVIWNDGTTSRIDLTGLVHRSRHFQIFARDAAAFRRVKPVAYGSGIGWANGIDYGAATLRMLADQQRALSGRDLMEFETRHGLNTAETAALFDVTERTLRSYREAKALPEPVAMALRALDRDPTVFAAHFRPVERRRGRPPKIAAA